VVGTDRVKLTGENKHKTLSAASKDIDLVVATVQVKITPCRWPLNPLTVGKS